MSSRKPLIYLGLFIVLALFYYFYEHKGGIERAGIEEQARNALHFSPDSATAFSITGDDGTISLERSDTGWVLIAPVQAKADSEAVARLLRSASDAAHNRVVEDSAADLSIFGLERPRLTFRVTPQAGAEQQVLKLGHKNPGDSYIYARNQERPNRVVLLNSWLLGDLDRTVFQLRDKSLLKFDKDEVERLTINPASGQGLELTRNGDSWDARTQQNFRAYPDSVDAILDKLLAAEAEGFIDQPPADWENVYQLDEPSLAVELAISGGVTRGIQFGARDTSGHYFAVRQGENGKKFLAGAGLFNILSANPSRLRDMALVDVERESITRVGYSGSGGEWNVTRGLGGSWVAERDSTGKWSFAEPAGERLDQTELDNFLYDLLDTRANGYVGSADIHNHGFRSISDFTISLTADGAESKIKFAYDGYENICYVSDGISSDSIAVIDTVEAAKLEKNLEQMKYRKVVELEDN